MGRDSLGWIELTLLDLTPTSHLPSLTCERSSAALSAMRELGARRLHAAAERGRRVAISACLAAGRAFQPGKRAKKSAFGV